MAVHREEGRFVVRIELSAEFGADYEGDDDGYAWLADWRARVQPRIARAIMAELRTDRRFSAVPASRGKSPDEELEVDVRFDTNASSPPKQGSVE